MPESDSLQETIRSQFPFPISHAYTYLESRADPEDRYQALLACFEVTLKTAAAITLANFTRDIQNDPNLGNKHLFQDVLDVLSRPLSLGHWHGLLHRTLRPYDTRRAQLVVPELFDFYYRITEHGNVKTQSQNVRLIQRFIQQRNEEAHHRSRSQTSLLQRRSQLSELEQDLETLLGELRFLARYPWLYVEHAEHHQGQWHYRANYAQGTDYPFHQDTWETTLPINSRRCLLVDEAKPAVLELDPFVIVTSEGRLQQPDIFFFDGLFSSGRAGFMNYHVNDYIDPTDEGSPASVASDAVKSLLRLLENRIPQPAEEVQDIEDQPSAVEVYREAVGWALEHGERQSISLNALRKILNLSREEALQQERELEAERGVEAMKLHELSKIGNAESQEALVGPSQVQTRRLNEHIAEAMPDLPVDLIIQEKPLLEGPNLRELGQKLHGESDRVEVQPDGRVFISCKALGTEDNAFVFDREAGEICHQPKAADELAIGLPRVEYYRFGG